MFTIPLKRASSVWTACKSIKLKSRCKSMWRFIHWVSDVVKYIFNNSSYFFFNAENNSYKCQMEQCQKEFLSAEGLRGHVKVLHMMQRIQCKLCPLQFLRKHSLQQHTFEHRGFDPYLCPDPLCCYTSKRKETYGKWWTSKRL
jgi:hypothetical protein